MRQALDLTRELFGENHPYTAQSYSDLAINRAAQRDRANAVVLLTRAVASYEAARLSVSSRGLERAIYGAKSSPYRSWPR